MGDENLFCTYWEGKWKLLSWAFRESKAIAVNLRYRFVPHLPKNDTMIRKQEHMKILPILNVKSGPDGRMCLFGAFRKRVNCFWCSLILSLGEILPHIWFWVAMCYYIFMPLNMYLLQFYAAHFHDLNCLSLLRDIYVFSQDHIKWEKYGK